MYLCLKQCLNKRMQTASTDISPRTGLNDRQIPRLTGLHGVVYIEQVAV